MLRAMITSLSESSSLVGTVLHVSSRPPKMAPDILIRPS